MNILLKDGHQVSVDDVRGFLETRRELLKAEKAVKDFARNEREDERKQPVYVPRKPPYALVSAEADALAEYARALRELNRILGA